MGSDVRKTELTEKIDGIVLNRFLGIPIFLAAMWVMFKLTFDMSKPFSDWIGEMISGPFKRLAEAGIGLLHAPGWTASLVTDGIFAGVGNVLVFVPVIFAMMFFITFLEGSGYMARAAFVMAGPCTPSACTEIFHSDAARIRVQRPRHLCDVDPRKSERQGAYSASHPLNVLRRAASGYVVFIGSLLPNSRRDGSLVSLCNGDSAGNRDGSSSLKRPFSGERRQCSSWNCLLTGCPLSGA